MIKAIEFFTMKDGERVHAGWWPCEVRESHFPDRREIVWDIVRKSKFMVMGGIPTVEELYETPEDALEGLV